MQAIHESSDNSLVIQCLTIALNRTKTKKVNKRGGLACVLLPSSLDDSNLNRIWEPHVT